MLKSTQLGPFCVGRIVAVWVREIYYCVATESVFLQKIKYSTSFTKLFGIVHYMYMYMYMLQAGIECVYSWNDLKRLGQTGVHVNVIFGTDSLPPFSNLFSLNLIHLPPTSPPPPPLNIGTRHLPPLDQ